MPTKRTKLRPTKVGIAPEGLAAWKSGDYHQLARQLGLQLYDWNPFEPGFPG
jgi:hypothetical protein